MQALTIIYREGINYHKTGITAMELVPEDQVQYSLYVAAESTRGKNMMQAMDALNKNFGKDMVRIASQGFSKKWHLQQARLSPCYTTRIEDVLTVKN